MIEAMEGSAGGRAHGRIEGIERRREEPLVQLGEVPGFRRPELPERQPLAGDRDLGAHDPVTGRSRPGGAPLTSLHSLIATSHERVRLKSDW